MNQYELQLDETVNIRDWYIDQSMFSTNIGFRNISSAYTPWGISAIDGQYCTLIRNVNIKVKQLYAINRRKYEDFCNIKTREVHMSFHPRTFYDPIELNDKYWDVRVEWENGDVHDFHYGDKPVFNLETRKTNPEQLKKEIIDNPHLHVKIKENLLLNLESYVKNGF
jgi:hypothetical protein